MRVRIPEGQLKYDFLKKEITKNSLRPDVEYLYADLRIDKPELKFGTALGMKAKVDLLPFNKNISDAGFGKNLTLAARFVCEHYFATLQ